MALVFSNRFKVWLNEIGHTDGALGRQHPKFLRCEAAVPRDIGKHLFRGLAGEASNGGANDSPKGQNLFMDGYQVNDVARLALIGAAEALFVARSAGCST